MKTLKAGDKVRIARHFGDSSRWFTLGTVYEIKEKQKDGYWDFIMTNGYKISKKCFDGYTPLKRVKGGIYG